MTDLNEAKALYIGRKVKGNGNIITSDRYGIVEGVKKLEGYSDGGIRLLVRDQNGNLGMWFWGYCELIDKLRTEPLPLPG
jgi:hypothetical protein